MSKGNLICSNRQEKILAALLDKYESSRTYRGNNQVNQNFAVDPARFFPDYRRDTASVEKVEAFEAELLQLAGAGLVSLEREHGEVARILMDKASIPAYYDLLDRLPRAVQEQKEIGWYREQLGLSMETDSWCEVQIRRLEQGKRAVYTLEETGEIFCALRRILTNREEILERELSIDVFGDSKYFEKGVRRKVCRVLRESGLYEEILEGIDEPRLCEQVMLGEHRVVPNPTYLYMKGNGRIVLESGGHIALSPADPIAISSKSLPGIREIITEDPVVMTVENLTAFQRLVPSGQFLLYLGGYHSTDKALFLKRIASDNPGREFRHFGDLDPDGLLIIEHLRRRTELDFRPWKMGAAELERYSAYGKPLEKQDHVKAENLLAAGRYVEVIRYMLEHDLKLEQEIIAWKLT